MSHTSSAPPLDASGVFAWRLLEFLSNKRPSAQEELGNRRLDKARDLAVKNEVLIDPRDLAIAKDKFILTTEIRAGLGSKRGISKFIQAREYSKAAKDALRFVETVSARVQDERLGQWSAGLNALLNATGGTVDPHLCAEMKPKVATLVETLYHFNTSQAHDSIRFNVRLTQMLLKDMNFVYPETWDGGRRHNPYRHPIIQRIINTTLFRNKDDVGVVHHEHFFPMPIPIIALILTLVEWCINEWSDGTRKDANWDDGKLQAVYTSHVSSLFVFKAHSPANKDDVLHQLQCDLLKEAREHAGVSPYPVGELGRFPPEVLDAIREGRDRPTSSDLPT